MTTPSATTGSAAGTLFKLSPPESIGAISDLLTPFVIKMDQAFRKDQEKFFACSKGLEVVFLILVMVLAVLKCARIWLQKPFDCE